MTAEFPAAPVNGIKPGIVVIVGPTASGKSELAVRLAEKFAGEIVNADSMQVYSEMAIGTARPPAEMLVRVPHHLFGIVPPDINFTAADFRHEARGVITGIIGRGKLPVISGGTGLYIRVLLGGLAESPTGDAPYRQELLEFAAVNGLAALHARLQAVDPDTAVRLHPNDLFRVIRALEVYQQTGRTFTDLQAVHQFSESWCRALKIGIHVERAELYARIERRVDQMLADGLVAEVRQLLDCGYSAGMKAMGAIGYREISEHLGGKSSLSEAVELIKRNTRRYAKRQLTWFRNDPEISWFRYPDAFGEISALVSRFLDE